MACLKHIQHKFVLINQFRLSACQMLTPAIENYKSLAEPKDNSVSIIISWVKRRVVLTITFHLKIVEHISNERTSMPVKSWNVPHSSDVYYYSVVNVTKTSLNDANVSSPLVVSGVII